MRAGFCTGPHGCLDRNLDVPAALHLPAGRVVSRTEAMGRFPNSQQGLTGAPLVRLHHAGVRSADRVLCVGRGGTGRRLANYDGGDGAVVDARRVTGIQSRRSADWAGGGDRLARHRQRHRVGGRPPAWPGWRADSHSHDESDESRDQSRGRRAAGRPVPVRTASALVPWRRRALLAPGSPSARVRQGATLVADSGNPRHSSTISTTRFADSSHARRRGPGAPR